MDCGLPISIGYPLVELAVGVFFVLIAVATDPSWWLALGAFAWACVVLSIIDVKTFRLPIAVVWWSGAFIALGLITRSVTTGEPWLLVRAAIGAACLGGFYGVVWLINSAGIGFGDVRLSVVIGAVLGAWSAPALVVGGFSAFVVGVVVAVPAMIRSSKGLKTKIPFGPSMVVGAWLGILAGTSLAHVYTSYLGI